MDAAAQKRSAGQSSQGSGSQRQRGSDGKATKNVQDDDEQNEEGLQFEDPFGDEFEDEQFDDELNEQLEDNDGDNDDDDDDDGDEGGAKIRKEQASRKSQGQLLVDEDEENEGGPKEVWRPGVDQIPEGEALEYDPSAYVMYHSLQAEWPCLSFDIMRDTLGENRQRFPLTMFAVTGSQADRADKNKVTLLKLSDLQTTQTDEDDEDEDENVDEDPTIEHVNVAHAGGVNRIRSMPQNPGFVATMADTSQVHIFDFSDSLRSMMTKGPRGVAPTKPLFSFRGHRSEGYALDWSPAAAGRLATGDCAGAIHVWNGSGANWQVDAKAFTGHTGSVEDIQWSPTEGTVFSSASSDRTVRIWDTRGKTGPQISIDAHLDDVNVISWNRSVAYLLASGCEDGSFKVWDLRAVRDNKSPLAHFKYHKGPVSSIEWAPHDESVICLSSRDNQVTVWDLSVEADDAASAADPFLTEFPAQLLFIHQGQTNVKEIHFHPQIPGLIMSTAEDGFNVFKPAISVA